MNMRVIAISIFSLCFVSFYIQDDSCLNFLYYNLPLNKSTGTIKESLKADKNFKIFHSSRDWFQTRHVQAKIIKPNTYFRSADSAIINLNLLSWFYYGNKAKQEPKLKRINLCLYFNSYELRNAECDTLEKMFTGSFSLSHVTNYVIYTDGPNGKDTISETGKIYLLSGSKKYPQLEFSKNTFNKKNKTPPYIELTYIDLN